MPDEHEHLNPSGFPNHVGPPGQNNVDSPSDRNTPADSINDDRLNPGGFPRHVELVEKESIAPIPRADTGTKPHFIPGPPLSNETNSPDSNRVPLPELFPDLIPLPIPAPPAVEDIFSPLTTATPPYGNRGTSGCKTSWLVKYDTTGMVLFHAVLILFVTKMLAWALMFAYSTGTSSTRWALEKWNQRKSQRTKKDHEEKRPALSVLDQEAGVFDPHMRH